MLLPRTRILERSTTRLRPDASPADRAAVPQPQSRPTWSWPPWARTLGGSIRIPASYCGIVGLKPTSGRVSRYGVLPLDFSLDHMGPLTRSVRDAAILLNAIAGYDARDDTSSQHPVPDFEPPPEPSLRGIRVGLAQNFFFDRVDREVAQAVQSAASRAEHAGAIVIPVTVPDIAAVNQVGRVILLCEAAAIFGRDLASRAGDVRGRRPAAARARCPAPRHRVYRCAASAPPHANRIRRALEQNRYPANADYSDGRSPRSPRPRFRSARKRASKAKIRALRPRALPAPSTSSARLQFPSRVVLRRPGTRSAYNWPPRLSRRKVC